MKEKLTLTKWIGVLLLLTAITTAMPSKGQVASLPWNCNFESATDGSQWTLTSLTGNNHWSIGSAANSSNSLYISDDNGVHNTYSTSSFSAQVASVDIDIPFDSIYTLEYDWQCYGEQGFDFMRVAIVPSAIDLGSISDGYGLYRDTLPAGWIAMDGGQLSRRGSWSHNEASCELQQGTYHLVFGWWNDGAGGIQPPAAVDNISLRIETCPSPQQLALIDATSESVTLGWNPANTNGWEVEYGHAGFILGQGTQMTAASNSIVIGELVPGSAYDVYVKAMCPNDEISHASMITVRTQCTDGAISQFPWIEDFENGLDCMSQEYRHGHVDWTTSNGCGSTVVATAHGGEANAMFTHQSYDDFSTLLVLPQMNLTGKDTVTMSFWHAQPNYFGDYDSLALYYRTSAGGDWTRLEGWSTRIDQWQKDSITMTNTSNFIQFAFAGYADYGYGALIDDIRVEATDRPVIAECLTPTQFHIDRVVVSTATLSWTPGGDETNWEVEYGLEGFEQGSGRMASTTTPHATLFRLSLDTHYDAYVRADCGDGQYSEWCKTSFETQRLLVGIDEAAPIEAKVWPNPSRGEFNIDLEEGCGTAEITIYDARGSVVMTTATHSQRTSITIPETGMYMMRITTENGTTTKKVIVH